MSDFYEAIHPTPYGPVTVTYTDAEGRQIAIDFPYASLKVNAIVEEGETHLLASGSTTTYPDRIKAFELLLRADYADRAWAMVQHPVDYPITVINYEGQKP